MSVFYAHVYFSNVKGFVRLHVTFDKCSLRSWRYCGHARNKVLVAEPPEASGEAHSPHGFTAHLSALPPKLYFACAYNTASYAG